MRKITQFHTHQDYYLDEQGFIYNKDGKMKSRTIYTIDGPVTRTRDKWYCIVYFGAPSDGKFYTKRKNGKLEWAQRADKSFLNLNSYVPEIDDFRTTYFYYLCNIQDGIPKYIGKTINPKSRISSHIRDTKNCTNHKTNWINKVISEGGEIEMVIVDELIPDGTLGSGDWRWLEQYWANQFIQWGFDIILDGGWGNGGAKRKATKEEVIKQQELQAQVSGVKTYVYEIYNNKEYIFNSCTEAERFLKELKVWNGKSQLSRECSFIGSDYIISKSKRLSKEEIKKLTDKTTRVRLKVVQLDKDDNVIKIHDSCRSAMREYGSTVASVLDVNKMHKTAYGFKWVYLKDYIN